MASTRVNTHGTTTSPLKERKLILDIETSDVDDVLNLLFVAGHPLVDLRAVTVTPGSPAQLLFVRRLLEGVETEKKQRLRRCNNILREDRERGDGERREPQDEQDGTSVASPSTPFLHLGSYDIDAAESQSNPFVACENVAYRDFLPAWCREVETVFFGSSSKGGADTPRGGTPKNKKGRSAKTPRESASSSAACPSNSRGPTVALDPRHVRLKEYVLAELRKPMREDGVGNIKTCGPPPPSDSSLEDTVTSGKHNCSSPWSPGWQVLFDLCDEETTLMTGGPVHNLGKAIQHAAADRGMKMNENAEEENRRNTTFTLGRWVAQGGYAGSNIVPRSAVTLSKFVGKETCQTWNFDQSKDEATAALACLGIGQRICCSKNVCHQITWTDELEWKMRERVRTLEEERIWRRPSSSCSTSSSSGLCMISSGSKKRGSGCTSGGSGSKSGKSTPRGAEVGTTKVSRLESPENGPSNRRGSPLTSKNLSSSCSLGSAYKSLQEQQPLQREHHQGQLQQLDEDVNNPQDQQLLQTASTTSVGLPLILEFMSLYKKSDDKKLHDLVAGLLAVIPFFWDELYVEQGEDLLGNEGDSTKTNARVEDHEKKSSSPLPYLLQPEDDADYEVSRKWCSILFREAKLCLRPISSSRGGGSTSTTSGKRNHRSEQQWGCEFPTWNPNCVISVDIQHSLFHEALLGNWFGATLSCEEKP
ncbi:unnamed protein product [Amoebophrya sp. A25]|nr:unnamed protein product [Amoebophrya sp. A25]|eukprot:GSA25T00017140001.1